ncbi:hypothetical protein [Streptomyces gobiensis]|uniref:hypothetical protein n=1 Tax=Streptomyces gobiensis TaxID=2875706 RepID=UPI001E3D3A92|nr:hypothetical protein [Streptomyces gobiensis]UGY91416.1 hypothetical protein test1122_06565 [Streptomyces gobiensis]
MGSVAAAPPSSDEGGKRGPDAPAGVKLSTLLPTEISVDNKTGRAAIDATVVNAGDKKTTGDTLSVFGFEGLKLRGVEGCRPLPKDKLAEGSNSGYICDIGKLDPKASQNFAVSASYDLAKTGRICLVVTQGKSEKLVWQQGPVPFGTEEPPPNAPKTPLLLGTVNKPDAKPGKPGLAETGLNGYAKPFALFSGALVLLGGAAVLSARREPHPATR